LIQGGRLIERMVFRNNTRVAYASPHRQTRVPV
jgi:hypothetical protein